jgi:uroporphyrin-III C-methyltransferase
MKAARLLQKADIIFYDRLVDESIMEFCSPAAELVFVGKEPGKPCRAQDEINKLLADAYHTKGGCIVRLKGGDPFVFGRGGEEGLYLQERKIPFEIVPGVSSSISAAAYAGIPVTHRNIACSFTVVTGHESPDKDETQVPWESLGAMGTLVFMMSVGNRKEIAQRLIEGGRPANEPVAFIENGTTPKQKVIKSTLSVLAEGGVEVESPAVMIVGPVVNLSENLDWFSPELLKEPSIPQKAPQRIELPLEPDLRKVVWN